MRHDLKSGPLGKTGLSNAFDPNGLAAPTARLGESAPAPVKLDVRHVGFRFGDKPALRDISFPIYANRVTALIGPSGCGKSTLLRVFNRMADLYEDQHVEGQVLLDGEETIEELKSVSTLVIVTHNLQQAARIADYTAFLYLGELIEFGSSAQMFSAPREARTLAYISGRMG